MQLITNVRKFAPRKSCKTFITKFQGAIVLFTLGILLTLPISACAKQSNQQSVTPHSPTQERIVNHKLGQVRVPLHPQRVVALGNPALDAVLALDVKPIGVATWGGVNSLDGVRHLFEDETTEEIEYLGQDTQVNLEKLLALKPDLILGV